MLSGVNGKRVVVPLSVLTLVSMISSYFREIFIAAKFGTGFQADAYLSVATIVRFICDVGPCAVLLACVVPVVASLLEQPQSVRRHLVGVLTLISLGGTVLLALALYIAMPWLLSVAAPGFGVSARQASQELAVGLVWFLPLQTTSFLFSLILNAHGRFWLVAASPIMANGLFVLALSAGLPGMDDLTLATLSGPGATLLLLAFQLWRMRLFGLCRSPEATRALRSLWEIARPMTMSLGLGSSTGLLMICHLLLRRQGSLAGEGTVASLAYAFRIYEVPVSLVANIAGTLVLPSLSVLHGVASSQRMAEIFRKLAEWGVLLLTPVVVVTLLDAPVLVDLLLAHGRFNAADTARTAEALRGFAPAILFEAGIVVFYRVAYAIRRPNLALISSLAVLTCMAAMIALVSLPVGGLALTFSCSFAIGLLVLGSILLRQFGSAVLPFQQRFPALLVVLAVSGLAALPLCGHPLLGALLFGAAYIGSALFLLPDHRTALVSVLRGVGV